MTKLFSRTEVEQWIDNDEGLYNWWLSSKLSKRDFMHANRKAIETSINLMNSGQKPMHYLAYDMDIQDKDIRK